MNVEISEGTSPDEKRYYCTSDISHAAAIVASGHELIEVRSVKGRSRGSMKSEFVFRKPGMSELLISYSNCELSVDAKTLLDSLRNLKSIGVGRMNN